MKNMGFFSILDEPGQTLSPHLKMLGLYLHALIMRHKFCNVLSIQHQLTLQKELQNFMTNNL